MGDIIKNSLIYKLKSKIILKIEGKNVIKFVKRIYQNNIEILGTNYKNKNEIEIKIYKKDLEKIKNIKTIYQIDIKDYKGLIKIKQKIEIYKYLCIFLVLGYIFLIFLSNVIFKIDVIHSNKEIRNLVKSELRKNGIEKLKLKKSYKELQEIKEKIKQQNKDRIDWIEIIDQGTKYEVRVEERKITKIDNNNIYRSIVANKDAVIKKIIAQKGEIKKNINDYVQKGDEIISGNITLNEKEKGKTKSEGVVYGEVWYVIKVNYPFIYEEKKLTNKKQTIYTVKILNKKIELSLKHFKNKEVVEEEIFNHNLLPIKISKEKQTNQKIISQILTFDEALVKAQKYAENKINSQLNDKEYIIKTKYLKSEVKDSKIEVEMFFAVYEDITSYKEIG